jgi:hypothetical protein
VGATALQFLAEQAAVALGALAVVLRADDDAALGVDSAARPTSISKVSPDPLPSSPYLLLLPPLLNTPACLTVPSLLSHRAGQLDI